MFYIGGVLPGCSNERPCARPHTLTPGARPHRHRAHGVDIVVRAVRAVRAVRGVRIARARRVDAVRAVVRRWNILGAARASSTAFVARARSFGGGDGGGDGGGCG